MCCIESLNHQEKIKSSLPALPKGPGSAMWFLKTFIRLNLEDEKKVLVFKGVKC